MTNHHHHTATSTESADRSRVERASTSPSLAGPGDLTEARLFERARVEAESNQSAYEHAAEERAVAERERDAARAEVAALRSAVSALADECERAIGAAQQPDITPLRFRDVADRLRYLASVGSSGEAESGEHEHDLAEGQ